MNPKNLIGTLVYDRPGNVGIVYKTRGPGKKSKTSHCYIKWIKIVESYSNFEYKRLLNFYYKNINIYGNYTVAGRQTLQELLTYITYNLNPVYEGFRQKQCFSKIILPHQKEEK